MWQRLVLLSLFLLALIGTLIWFRADLARADSGVLTTAWTADRDWDLGTASVTWDHAQRQLRVQGSEGVVWASPPGRPWLQVLNGELPPLHRVRDGRFSQQLDTCDEQFWFDQERTGQSLILQGELECSGVSVRARLQIQTTTAGGVELNWSLLEADSLPLAATVLAFELPDSEAVFGFGHQVGTLNRQGERVLLDSHSQPGSRTGARAGTLWPVGITRHGRGLVALNPGHQILDLRAADSARLEVWDQSEGRLEIYRHDHPRALLTTLGERLGFMPGLPDFMHRRALLGTARGAAAAQQMLDELARESTSVGGLVLDVPLQSGWPVSADELPWRPGRFESAQADWAGLLERLDTDDLPLLGSRNPLLQPLSIDNQQISTLADITAGDPTYRARILQPELGDQRQRRVLQLDTRQEPVRDWLGVELAANRYAAVQGWVSNWYEPLPGREELPQAAAWSAREARQRDWLEWQQAQAEPFAIAREPMPADNQRRPEALLSGLNTTSWGARTGLQASLTALLSGGVSGLTVAHNPVGGTATASQLWWSEPRDTELFLRWLELNTFTSLLRLHEGDQPHRHVQVTDSVGTRIHFDRLARLYEGLFPYRQQLMQEAAERGWPLVRPLWLVFPEDPETWALAADQFMLGDHLLVVPALSSGTVEREFYLPAGEWTHLWDQRRFESSGERRRMRTPIGEPLVLVHADFPDRETLLALGAELAIANILDSF